MNARILSQRLDTQALAMPLNHYDPDHAPDPEAWLALSEDERLALILAWHDANDDIGSANPRVHAAVHVIIENQIAEQEPPLVATKLRQLMVQGLDRHDAIHAIAFVLTKRMNADMKRSGASVFSVPLYEAGLHRLNARSWRRIG